MSPLSYWMLLLVITNFSHGPVESDGTSNNSSCIINPSLSQIQTLTSKIARICQDICDIKLRRLLITQSDKEHNDITNILTNQSDCKNIWGSSRSRPVTLDIHQGHADVTNTAAHLKDFTHMPRNS